MLKLVYCFRIMKTYLGKTGLDKTWQDSFPETVKCHKCGEEARIMFVAMEDDDEDFICNLYENTGGQFNGKFWPHDCIACAVYLCSKCFEPNALLNQA